MYLYQRSKSIIDISILNIYDIKIKAFEAGSEVIVVKRQEMMEYISRQDYIGTKNIKEKVNKMEFTRGHIGR